LTPARREPISCSFLGPKLAGLGMGAEVTPLRGVGAHLVLSYCLLGITEAILSTYVQYVPVLRRCLVINYVCGPLRTRRSRAHVMTNFGISNTCHIDVESSQHRYIMFLGDLLLFYKCYCILIRGMMVGSPSHVWVDMFLGGMCDHGRQTTTFEPPSSHANNHICPQ
jgi:hypothetical protein